MKMITLWDNHFQQVSLGLDKKCGFLIIGQFLNVFHFFDSAFMLTEGSGSKNFQNNASDSIFNSKFNLVHDESY